jgi:hypothetical protein
VGTPTEAKKSVKALSEFYLYPQPEDFPDDYTFVIPYTLAAGDTAFEIAVYAVDSMGLKSEPIVYESKPGDIPDDVEVPVTGNLFVNGDFEQGNKNGWTAWQGSNVSVDAAKNGAFGMHATGSGGWGTMISQTVDVTAGKTYMLSFWYKANAVGANVQVKRNNNDGAMYEGTGGWYSRNEWTYVEYKFTADTDKIFFNVCGGGNGNAESVYFDDFTLVEMGVKVPDLIEGGETSRTEETKTGLGLAFKFDVNANGIGVKNVNVVDYTNATVTIDGVDYKLVDMGAVMSNDTAVGLDADMLTLDNLSDRTIQIQTKYLMTWGEDGISYAVRIINIPVENEDTIIYARPYYTVEMDGELVTIYGDVYKDNYVGKIDVNDGVLEW